VCSQTLVDPFDELVEVAFVPQAVEGGETDVLGFDEGLFEDLFVVLCDVYGFEFVGTLVVPGDFALVVEEEGEVALEGVGGCVRVDLHHNKY